MTKIRSKDIKGVGYASVSEIDAVPVPRISSGFYEFDWMYGHSGRNWGIPTKTISLWAADNGTGKSRVAVTLAKSFVERGMKVLYIQGELPLENYVDKIHADPELHKNLFLSEEVSMDGISSMIYDIDPDLVIVDSVNQIPEFKFGGKLAADILIDGDDEHIGFRKTCNDTDTIMVLLCQVNTDGSSKGGSVLPHLVDVSMVLEPCKENEVDITIKIGSKNRYGKKGPKTVWRHTDKGCSPISDNRIDDKDWHDYLPIELLSTGYQFDFNLDIPKDIPVSDGSREILGPSLADIDALDFSDINPISQDFILGDSFEDRKITASIARAIGDPNLVPHFSFPEKVRMVVDEFRVVGNKPIGEFFRKD